MTAVEYLIKEFSDILGVIKTQPMQDLLLVDAINKAKEIEKQQQDYFAIEFVEWVLNSNLILNRITAKELLEKFKNK